ncbi:hypothetical protein [Amycolatopsis thermoflava]|uniref:hypothetical protein n=1 Tax=Amycolatopsis thermoflava TaxID=84480 RepID=UPI003F4A0384
MRRLRARILGGAPTGAQVVGGLAAVAGLYLLAGLAWALLVAGVTVAAVGTLAELARPAKGGS